MNISIIILLFLCNFSALSLFSAENASALIFNVEASIGIPTAHSLTYCDPDYVNNTCNTRWNGIACPTNDAFLPVCYNSCHIENLQKDLQNRLSRDSQNFNKHDQIKSICTQLKKLTHLPLSVLSTNGTFKQLGTNLFIFEHDLSNIEVKINVQLAYSKQTNLQTLIDNFRKEYQCILSGQLDPNVNYKGVETELLKNGTLATIDGKIVHGPKGYFGPGEYYKKIWQYI